MSFGHGQVYGTYELTVAVFGCAAQGLSTNIQAEEGESQEPPLLANEPLIADVLEGRESQFFLREWSLVGQPGSSG